MKPHRYPRRFCNSKAVHPKLNFQGEVSQQKRFNTERMDAGAAITVLISGNVSKTYFRRSLRKSGTLKWRSVHPSVLRVSNLLSATKPFLGFS